MRSNRLSVSVALALSLAALSCAVVPAAARERQGESFHWAGTLAPGKTVRVKGVNGSIRAELAGGAQVVVDAEKWGRRSDPDEVKIEVDQDADGVMICARYPRQWWGGLNDCRGFANTRSDVRVEYTVRVPAGVKLALTTVNGAVEARDLRGPVRARTVNGSVRISTSDRADAKTVNGSIVARMRPSTRGEMEFASVNGSIRLELPSDVQADVRGFTINGAIRSDFPIATRGGWIGRRLKGRLGNGGPDIKLVTVNGSITLGSL